MENPKKENDKNITEKKFPSLSRISPVTTLAVSGDGFHNTLILTGHKDGTVNVWLVEGDVSTQQNLNMRTRKESVDQQIPNQSRNNEEKPIYIPIHLSTLIAGKSSQKSSCMNYNNNLGTENFIYAPIYPAFPIEACKSFLHLEISEYFRQLLGKNPTDMYVEEYSNEDKREETITQNNSSMEVTSISVSDDQSKVYVGRINGEIEEFESLNQHIHNARSYKTKETFEKLLSSLF